MSKSPDLGVPLLAQSQANPDITHNEALLLFQALSNGVINMTTSAPPGSPVEGDSYIVGAAPTGAWVSRANHIAIFWGGAWRFVPDRNAAGVIIPIGARHEGLRVYDRNTNALYVWTGAAWSAVGAPGFSEGTFTPTLTFATPGTYVPGYTTQQGNFTRVGNRVHASIRLAATPTIGTASGLATVGGLPFTAGGNAALRYEGNGRFDSASPVFPGGGTYPIFTVSSGASVINLGVQPPSLASVSLNAADFTTGVAYDMRLNISYLAA